MLFEPKLNATEIPRIMKAVARIAPFGYWKKRIAALEQETQQNPLLINYFDQEFRIERSYGAAHQYHRVTGRYPDISDDNYELFSFLAMLEQVHERLTEKGQSRLSGSIRDGLRDKKGLSPLATELRTASQLMAQGFDVQFTDLEDIARFDFLISKGEIAIEIDCKAVSGDIGRQIHGWRLRWLANELMPVLQELVDLGEGHLVEILLQGNLHGDIQYERSLARQIGVALRRNNGSTSKEGFSISFYLFDINDSPFATSSRIADDFIRNFVLKKFNLQNVNAVTRYSPGLGAVILVIRSEKPDHVVEGIYRQLRDSANRQFSTRRPAVLCVQLRDMTATQLHNLHKESINGLREIATRLFHGDNRSHLAGLSFVATSGTMSMSRSISDGMLHTSHQDIGAAYTFGNPGNPSAKVIGAMFGGAGGSGG
jgi:hypothetical protein